MSAVLCACVLAAGCSPSPIGDPCMPESIPADGFDSREVYVETSSVQCRTRVCMVYKYDGDPEHDACDADGNPAGCRTEEQIQQQVFCTCRCSIPDGIEASTPLCNCGDGFTCVDDVVNAGPERAGVAGGYCVPCIGPNDDRGLDVSVFPRCPGADAGPS